jgi:hypothetical protein
MRPYAARRAPAPAFSDSLRVDNSYWRLFRHLGQLRAPCMDLPPSPPSLTVLMLLAGRKMLDASASATAVAQALGSGNAQAAAKAIASSSDGTAVASECPAWLAFRRHAC